METKARPDTGSVGTIQMLQMVADHLQLQGAEGAIGSSKDPLSVEASSVDATTVTRTGLLELAAKVTEVHNMLEALSLDLANQYRSLVTSDLAAPDPDGRKAPLTGKRLIAESHRVTGQDLSPAWHLSPAAARIRVGLARTSAEYLPQCLESLRRGEAGEEHLTAVMRESIVLDVDDQARMDGDLAPLLGSMTVRQTKAAAHVRACELDAATMVERAERAAKHSHVSIRPAPDSMTRLSALLPLKDGVAIDVALTRHAQKLKAQGDARSLGQIKAALLVQWVRDGAAREDQNETMWNRGRAMVDTGAEMGSGAGHSDGAAVTPEDLAPAVHRGTPRVEVRVTITDLALLGLTDTPAYVDGYGAVPAGLARQMIRDATDSEQATLRRLWTRPDDGTLTQMESKSRIFPKGLARFVRARDQVCITPFCGAPIRQIDHVKPHSAGGPTTASNAQGLCAACNQVKEFTNIRSGAPPGLPSETASTLHASGLSAHAESRRTG